MLYQEMNVFTRRKSYKVKQFVEFLQGKKSHKAFPYIQQRLRIIVLLKTFVGIRLIQTFKQTDSLFEFLRQQTDLNNPLLFPNSNCIMTMLDSVSTSLLVNNPQVQGDQLESLLRSNSSTHSKQEFHQQQINNPKEKLHQT